MDGDASPGTAVLLLGHLIVERDGSQTAVLGGQQGVLLTLLALRLGRAVPTDQLIDAAWDGRPPSSAAAALRVHIAKLRALLADNDGPSPLRHVANGYLLDGDLVETDVRAASRLVARARAAKDGDAALRDYTTALGLWRGDPFSGVREVAWLRQEGQHLRELRLDIEDELSAVQLASGRHLELCADLAVLVKEQPLREGRTRHLMLALYRSGRQADALVAYGELRDMLAEDLGVDPSGETRQLELDILRHEPALSPALGAAADPEVLLGPGHLGALDRPRSAPMVRDVVRQRLGQLEPADREAVRIVAVLSQLAALETTAAAAQRHPDELLGLAGRAPGLLAPYDERQTLRFARAALRDEVLVDLPDETRAELHARCAQAIEQTLPGLLGHVAAAWHRVGVAILRPGGDCREAGFGILRALDACRSAGRGDLVDELARAALAEATWPPSIEIDLTLRLVVADQVLNRATEATEAWERGLDLARATDDAERFALLALSRDWTQRSMLAPGEVRPLLEEALDRLGPQPSALRVAIASAYLGELATPGRADELGDLLAEVRRQAEALGDLASMRTADYAGHVLLRGSPNVAERQLLARRLWAALERDEASPLWRAEALLARIYDAFTTGDLDLAESLAEDLGVSAGLSGSVRLRWQHAITLASLSREHGDFANADDLAEEAMLLGAEGAIPDALGADALHRLQVLFHTGSLDSFLPTIELFAEAQPDNPLVLAARALVLSSTTAYDESSAIHPAVVRLRRLAPHDEVVTVCAALVVEAGTLSGRLDETTRSWLHEVIDPFAGQFVTFGQVSATWGPVDRLLAMLALLDGEQAHAAELLSAARATSRSELWQTRIETERGRLIGG